VFSTKTHIKYLLPNGDSGIVKSLSDRLYIAAVREKTVIGLNGDGEVRRVEIDLTEARFKAALARGDMPRVSSILQHAKLCSESIVDYLQKQNHPEVALEFVDDADLKFRLAVSAGNLEVAQDAARRLNNPAVWDALADEAVAQGRFEIAEAALVKSENLEKLAFFLLISGQINALRKLKVDEPLAVQRAIWLGDRPALAEMVRESAPALAEIASQGADLVALEPADGAKKDWQLMKRRVWVAPRADEPVPDEGWDFEMDIGDKETETPAGEPDLGNGWDFDVDIEVGDIPAGANTFVPPEAGRPVQDAWLSSATEVAGAFVAAGKFGEAIRVLREQIGLANPEPLRARFVSTYLAANAVVGPAAAATHVPLFGPAPAVGTIRDAVSNLIQAGYALMNAKQTMQQAVKPFTEATCAIPLIVCPTEADTHSVEKDLVTCRTYLTALALDRAITSETDKARQIALAAYLADRELESRHRFLTLQLSFNGKCLKLAGEFAARVMRVPQVAQKAAETARKICAAAQAQKEDDLKVEYLPRSRYEVCCKSLKPIYEGTEKKRCPYCGAFYQAQFLSGEDITCEICKLAKVGFPGSGVKFKS
jgi:coatomer protein complex subunit alpha (xenin)